jgi:hypothetical protein
MLIIVDVTLYRFFSLNCHVCAGIFAMVYIIFIIIFRSFSLTTGTGA